MAVDRRAEFVAVVLLLRRAHLIHVVGVEVGLQSRRLHSLYKLISMLPTIVLRSSVQQRQLRTGTNLRLRQYGPAGLALALSAGAWH